MDEIVPLLKDNFLTKNLNDDEIMKLAGAMKPMTFLPSDILIKYGDVGQEYFILSQGQVQITVYEKGTNPNDPELESKILLTKFMSQGSGFGELALLYNDKRSATITAVDVCETYTLDGIIFKAITIKSSI
jgi:CRP-like cAMP-binding protein